MPRWTFIILFVFFLILGNYGFNDLGNALKELGGKILPNYQFLGILIILFIFLFIAFTDEFLRFFNLIERRIKNR